MNFEPDYDVYNEAPPEDEDEGDEDNYLDRLDRVYRTRSERIINTGIPEQDFSAELAELRANLREMRLVLAEIGKAIGPWPGHPDTF